MQKNRNQPKFPEHCKTSYTEDSFEFMIFSQNKIRQYNKNTSNKRKQFNIILTSIIVVLCLVIVYEGYSIIKYYYDLFNNETIARTASTVVDEHFLADFRNMHAQDGASEDMFDDLGVPQMGAIYNLHTVEALQIQFQTLDILAYISIEGTNIAYPVVQSLDNNYYLRRDVYGKSSAAGSLFLDYRNSDAITDKNSIIYGHNMKNGSMFHNLNYYEKANYMREHKYIVTIEYSTCSLWEVAVFFQTDTTFNYMRSAFDNDDDFLHFVDEINSRRLYDSGTEITASDQLLTLSTCAEDNNYRSVVVAKLVERRVID